MDWFQFIITIISSSALTAFVTGIFNYRIIKTTNEENEKQRKFDIDFKIQQEEKLKKEQSQHQQAENLYKIILPAIKCEVLKTYIKEPNVYHLDVWGGFI